MDTYSRLDTWETLKGFVLDHAPRLATSLVDSQRQTLWRHVTTGEAQLLAVMVALDFDLESAAARRKARQFLKEILDESSGGAVRETEPELIARLDDKQRAQLSQAVAWIASNPPAQFLQNISGPRAAVTLVEKKVRALKGLRAYRWLAALNYPIIIPDQSRQRFLVRMGWMPRVESTQTGRAMALTRMEELARELGATPTELDLILSAFCGAAPDAHREAACCTMAPRCERCPFRDRCPHYEFNMKEQRAKSRCLTVTTRREQRPRERLEAQGPGVLTDEELLAIVLRTGAGGINALDLAQQLLLKAGTLDRLAAMSVAELARMPAMGKVKAVTVKAALELARRLRESSSPAAQMKMNSSRRVFEHLRPRFTGAKKEEFHVLLLDTKLQLIRDVRVSTGTLNQSLVHPREAFIEAIRDSAHAVIFAHNHPSGDPTPSREDFTVTTKLLKAGEVVGIQVMDHVIIGSDSYYSFADEGKLV